MTARRWASLTVRGGDDDMFSSDLTTEELRVRFMHGSGAPAPIENPPYAHVEPMKGSTLGILCYLPQVQLGRMDGTPTLVLISGNDEYVPEDVRTNAESLAQRLALAMGCTARAMVLAGAKHALQGAEEAGVSAMTQFLLRVLSGVKFA